jgi:hypothetical protein
VLTAANRDTVSHATAVGIMSLGSTTSIPLASSSSIADRKTLQAVGASPPSAWSGRIFGSMLQPHRAQGLSFGNGLKRALAVTASCGFSGTTTSTVIDNGDGVVGAGDVVTVVFNNCMNTPDETLNGTTTLAISGGSTTSLSARLTFAAYSDVTANHSLTLDGSMLFEFSQQSASAATFRTTADGPVVARITTHLPFSDTVTLQSGFTVQENVDISVAPPVGTTPGLTITTLHGRLESAVAGGSFDVSTSASLTKYTAENYPRAGVVRVKGNTGALTLTALSASDVGLDLDVNDDGTLESSETKSWDWLL